MYSTMSQNLLMNTSHVSSHSFATTKQGPGNVSALLESRRHKNNTSIISQDIIDRQKEMADTKNDFLKEKALEKKTLQNMI